MERIKLIDGEKRFFDFEGDTLSEFLTWSQFCSVTTFKKDITAEELSKAKESWREPPLTEEAVLGKMTAYLNEYGFDKAINHRGLSAGRTIQRLSAWCWLLGRDDLVTFINDDANYKNYGAPILKHVARAFGIPIPAELEMWVDGDPCRPGCDEGCDE